MNRATAAPSGRAFVPAAAVVARRVAGGGVQSLQRATSIAVSSPHDAAEREAERVARLVVRMAEPAPAGPVPARPSPLVARIARPIDPRRDLVARRGTGTTFVTPEVAALLAGAGPGSSLPPSVRRFMEPRFGASFDRVRIHADRRAATLSRALNARALTVGHQVFFGDGQFQPGSDEGRELIAHELAHTIQQGAAVQLDPRVAVSERRERQVQRLGLGDILDYFAEKAHHIPGFRMFTIVLGVNPINMSRVERSAANVLRAIVEFLPGGALITQALDNHGVFERAGAWVSSQFASLGMVGSAFKRAVGDFIDSLSWRDIFDLGDVWRRAKRIVTDPIDRLIAFARGLIAGLLALIRDAILVPLATLARGTRAYDLLCAVLGRDPITGAAMPQAADTLIGGFLRLIGQGEVWENAKRANAIPRLFAWFRGALGAVVGLVRRIPELFVTALRSLEIMDLILVPRVFAKIVGVFGTVAGSFITWGLNAVWNLLEILFDVISPGAWAHVKRTGAALRSILRDPIPFVRRLVHAAAQGFRGFATRFLTHLKRGLLDWLVGALPGVQVPRSLALGEVAAFVLSALGIAWSAVRARLARLVGEPTTQALESGVEFVAMLVRHGPAAAWEAMRDQLASLHAAVIGGISEFLAETVVGKAIAKLVSLFIPGAGFISAILSIYDVVMVFVRTIARIVQVVVAFIDSVASIAAGAVAAAAARIERVLAGLLTLAINFLAAFVGLGRIGDRIRQIIERVRAPIDRALDRLVTWIVHTARSFLDRRARATPSPARSAAVIAAVRRDIASRQRTLETPEQFRRMMSEIARSHVGLRTLSVRSSGEGEWTIEASASPQVFVGIVHEFVKTDYGSVVAAVAFDDALVGDPVRNSRASDHAEDKIIALVRTTLEHRKSFGARLPKKIEVFVSQSPCKKRCAPNLLTLRSDYPAVATWAVYYKSLYQGTSGKHTAESLEAIALMNKQGFHVLQWNAALQMQLAGTPVP